MPSLAESKSPADRLIVLLSHERSGSHYFADLLVSTGQVRSVDEVCNFNAVDPDKSEASFFRFRRAMQATDPDVALRPTPDAMARLVNAYFAHLAGFGDPAKRILIDIKYGHVHNFEIGWWPSEFRPFLLGYLDKLKVPIVHLRRRDALSAVISGHVADRIRAWHRKDGETAPAFEKMRLPAMRMAHDALLLEQEKQNFVRWLGGAHVFDVEYETIADDAVRDRALRELCAFLHIEPPSAFSSKFQKFTPPLRDVLENYDELVKTVRLLGDGKLTIA